MRANRKVSKSLQKMGFLSNKEPTDNNKNVDCDSSEG